MISAIWLFLGTLIAHGPARLGQQAVDVFSGFIFGARHYGYVENAD